MKNRISYVCVIGAALLWGCMGILVRAMNEGGLTSAEVVTFRSVVTATLMLLYMFLFKRSELKIKLKDIWCFLGTGICSVVFFNFCYFTCMKYCSLSTAAILLYTAPAFVTVMSFFLFKESLNRKKILALVIAFLGCVLVSGSLGSASIGVMGLLTGLGAGFGYALYTIFSRYAIERGYSSFTITTYTFMFASLGCFVMMEFGGNVIGGDGVGDLGIGSPGHMIEMLSQNSDRLFFYIIWAFLTTVAAYLLYTKGLSGMESGRASILANVEPVMATLVGVVIFGESLSLVACMGIALVVASSILLIKGDA